MSFCLHLRTVLSCTKAYFLCLGRNFWPLEPVEIHDIGSNWNFHFTSSCLMSSFQGRNYCICGTCCHLLWMYCLHWVFPDTRWGSEISILQVRALWAVFREGITVSVAHAAISSECTISTGCSQTRDEVQQNGSDLSWHWAVLKT